MVVDVSETHTSQPALVFFPLAPLAALVGDGGGGRCWTGRRCWHRPWNVRSPGAELCIRAGYVALRRIADFFGLRYDPDPH